jgi:sulfate-transporting ATPase
LFSFISFSNYGRWLEAKHQRLALQKKRDARLDKQIEKELAWIRNEGGKSKSRFRKRNFERLVADKEERLANKRFEGGTLLIPQGPLLANEAIKFQNVGFSLEGRKLFEGVNFTVSRGDIIGIIGSNGTGKSTLLRLLTGELPMQKGSIEVDQSVVFAYASQHRNLNPDNYLWREIVGDRDLVQITSQHAMPSRAYVAQFNFAGQDQQKLVGALSGGERNRLQLAKSLIHGSNVILLDEVNTNKHESTL